ncbi:addiction module protein [Roseateles asaccharophilus]|uniref:Addiction module component (TIGR02574 family) n=1 Tax=Roseateles asaccharophilus TaxID=582607 RepID=A0ABU2A791_9BURK|nr:addiction module protein [Roseateles asaccharophilus]MDR7333039.1 putative addiction module component (TIGR02574 family) [Roseateles asaccharophilus]
MSIDLAELRKLSVAERIQLAEDLWDSIALEPTDVPGLTDAQRQELQRRLREHESDPSTAVPWEQVRAELMSRMGPR